MGKSWKKIMEDFDDDGMSQAFCFWGGKQMAFRNRG